MRKLADGDFDVVLPGLERKDEIGAMANAVEGFKVLGAEKARREADAQANAAPDGRASRKIASGERAAAEQRQAGSRRSAQRGADEQVGRSSTSALRRRAVSKMSEGDTRRHRLGEGFTESYPPDQGRFQHHGDAPAGARSGRSSAATREIANASAEMSASTTDLSQRTEEQAASLEQTSASMEEMSATVQQERRERAAGQPVGERDPRDVADRGGQVVAKAVDAMARIEEFLAQDLRHHRGDRRDRAADQPAGAQRRGRGGARRRCRPRLRGGGLGGAQPGAALLAGRQGHQGPDHQQLEPGAGGRRSGQPGRQRRCARSSSSIKKVADIVAEIASASAEQSTGIDQVNKALTQMDEVTQQNSALVEENAATAKTLEHQARRDGRTHVAAFRLDDAAGRAEPVRLQRRRSRLAAKPPWRAKSRPVMTPKTGIGCCAATRCRRRTAARSRACRQRSRLRSTARTTGRNSSDL